MCNETLTLTGGDTMRNVSGITAPQASPAVAARTSLAAALAATLTLILASGLQAQDPDRAVADGGIAVAGWQGVVDAQAAEDGMTIDDARFVSEGDALRVTTGPASTYWRTGERLSGDYTVRATFTEPDYMARNTHPHPYGIVIAGNEMGTDRQRLLYCSAYGNGNFIVRGFGPEPFQMNGPRGGEHSAVNRAPGPGESVTQEIALSVRGDEVSCEINGTAVASYERADVLGEGQLTTTDGEYGLRFGHNTDVQVTGLRVER